MTSRVIKIHIKENIGSVEMYLNEQLYTTQKNENLAFGFLLKDYFKDLLIQLNLNKKQLKLDFFDRNFQYYKEYAEGLDLYIPTDIGYQQVQEIFRAIGYNLKVVSARHYQLECKRNLVEYESFVSPAIYHSSRENQWYIIGGLKEVPIPKEINLQFDILYIQLFCEPVEIPVDENAYRNYNDWESYNFTTDEDRQEKKDEEQRKLF